MNNVDNRVLHVVSSLSVGAGVMAVIMNYYRYIDRNKIQFDFLYFKKLKEGTYEEEIKRLGGRTILINAPSVSFKCIQEIKNTFKSISGCYKIMHLHELYLSALIIPIAKIYGVKSVIGHAHTNKFSDNPQKEIRNKLLCFPVKFLCDYQFACSEEAAIKYFGKSILRKKTYTLIYNAINVDKYIYNETLRKKYRKEFGFLDSDFLIGNIGRLSPQKNQHFLVKIFSEVIKKNENAKLIIIGEGELKDSLVNLCEQMNISNYVFFLGRRDDVDKIYNMFDLFILPSLSEGLGNVLIEAQCNGLKCIVSDGVPKKAMILDNYEVVKLEKSIYEWSASILACVNNKNRILNVEESMKIHNYDIVHEKDKLLKKYYQIIDTI